MPETPTPTNDAEAKAIEIIKTVEAVRAGILLSIPNPSGLRGPRNAYS